jgi:hypothetical protein
MPWFGKTDVYHITVAGENPHSVAAHMDEEDSPFGGEGVKPSVAQSINVNGQLVGGTVEVWAPEHLTPEQEQYLRDNPNVVDVRHVWGGDDD